MAQDERTLNMDLPDAVATAAREGNAEAVREWLAAAARLTRLDKTEDCRSSITLACHLDRRAHPSSRFFVRRAPATWEAAGLVREAV